MSVCQSDLSWINLPVDVWFEIAIMYGRYYDYLEMGNFIPGLLDEERCKRARRLLTIYTRIHDLETWTLDNSYHREDDLPAFVHEPSKLRQWFKHGQLHRDGDLPAVMSDSVYIAW